MMQSREERRAESPSGLVLTTDPKPRLRWTAELHERFVDAVTHLGGPDKATPKTIMRVMAVKAISRSSDLESSLTKEHSHGHSTNIRDTNRVVNRHRSITHAASMLDLQRNVVFSTPHIIGRNMNEMQMEVKRRIEEEVEVERQVNQRIEAQGKYMESMLEKACETQEASLTKGYSTLFFNNTSPLPIPWFEDHFPSSSSMDSTLNLSDIRLNFSLQDSLSRLENTYVGLII
ncbi:BnaA05g26440D [Brassica napus]|uniref:BnaA05g26440D protein n=1 Tax=Brassica napus TaxID=3708 RepID=A0A078F9F5_BRANA|nr:BnaA05g26440D [Brassica napus]